MWVAAAPMPYYSAYRTSRRKGSTSASASTTTSTSTSENVGGSGIGSGGGNGSGGGSGSISSSSKKDGAPSSPAPASHLQFHGQAQVQGHGHGQAPHPSSAAAAAAAAPPTMAHPNSNILNLLEPAVDGPPSPERIRALSKQMKRVSTIHNNKHHSHNTSSSGSLHSHTSDRPSWDHALESITLSRRSSGRSTSSSMPSRERPDSVQIFGKAIFGRKGKLKRESSIHSSSGSSLHSADVPLDAPTWSSKEPTSNRSLFGRRKLVKGEGSVDESSAALPKRLNISGPYNFQHVTHTRKDHLPTLQRASRMELVNEFSTLRTAPPSSDSSYWHGHGYRHGHGRRRQDNYHNADDLHFSDFPSDHTTRHADRPALLPRHTSPQTGPRRLVKPSRSQENLRVAPPRPPRPERPPRPARSPLELLEAVHAAAPPVPPPRLSSRQSIRYDGFDPLATTTLERPQTSGGFRQPGPLRFGAGSPTSPEPPSTSQGFSGRSDLEAISDPRFPHAVTTPDDEAWPLSSPTTATLDAPLPDVPEEEEHYTLARKSRASMISNNSSLRGSQSVPLLRQMAQAQAQAQVQGQSQPGHRPPSSGSDTLGRFDLFAAQRALRAAALADRAADDSSRDNWEDDIDYCYEHEAEADCYYEWTRPSMDVSRDDEPTPVFGGGLEAGTKIALGMPKEEIKTSSSPSLPTPSRFDVPALSPASQTSVHDAEAVTPTAAAMLVTSNFSLPRSDGGLRVQRPRPNSRASSFKESHGFNLSPSLLIPGDYRQQMMMAEMPETDMSSYDDSDAIFVRDLGTGGPEAEAGASHQIGSAADRASTWTTGTDESSHSGSSGERHASATSASTAFTRFTINSATADNIGDCSPKSDSTTPTFMHPDRSSLDKLPPARSDQPRPPQAECQSQPRFRSQSEAGDEDMMFAGLQPAPPPPPRSRRRANTTSLGTPPPPPGQYAIFPPVYAGSRI